MEKRYLNSNRSPERRAPRDQTRTGSPGDHQGESSQDNAGQKKITNFTRHYFENQYCHHEAADQPGVQQIQASGEERGRPFHQHEPWSATLSEHASSEARNLAIEQIHRCPVYFPELQAFLLDTYIEQVHRYPVYVPKFQAFYHYPIGGGDPSWPYAFQDLRGSLHYQSFPDDGGRKRKHDEESSSSAQAAGTREKRSSLQRPDTTATSILEGHARMQEGHQRQLDLSDPKLYDLEEVLGDSQNLKTSYVGRPVPDRIAGFRRENVSGHGMDCLIRAILVSAGFNQVQPEFEQLVTFARSEVQKEAEQGKIAISEDGMLDLATPSGMTVIRVLRRCSFQDGQPVLSPRRGMAVYSLDPHTGQPRERPTIPHGLESTPRSLPEYPLFLYERHYQGLISESLLEKSSCEETSSGFSDRLDREDLPPDDPEKLKRYIDYLASLIHSQEGTSSTHPLPNFNIDDMNYNQETATLKYPASSGGENQDAALLEKTAAEKGIDVPELKNYPINLSEDNKVMTKSEYRKWKREILAEKRGITVSQLYKQARELSAEKRGITVSQLYKQEKELAAKRKGITVSQYRKRLRESVAERKARIHLNTENGEEID